MGFLSGHRDSVVEAGGHSQRSGRDVTRARIYIGLGLALGLVARILVDHYFS